MRSPCVYTRDERPNLVIVVVDSFDFFSFSNCCLFMRSSGNSTEILPSSHPFRANNRAIAYVTVIAKMFINYTVAVQGYRECADTNSPWNIDKKESKIG